MRSVLLLIGLAALSGCYQMHSDDDLRSVPVTNNPNIVPSSGGGRGFGGLVPGVASYGGNDEIMRNIFALPESGTDVI